MKTDDYIQPRLAGFGGLFRSTESLWCIGSKICWANLISARQLYHSTNIENNHPEPNFLVTGVGLNFTVFTGLTGVDEALAKAGTGLRLLQNNTSVLQGIAFPFLRFCPKCMDIGFHSVLFQFPLFSCCPDHNVPLLEKCPACGALLEYRWPTAQNNAFTCHHCRRSLWNPRQQRYFPHPADARFEDLAEWAARSAQKVLCHSKTSTPLKRWIQARKCETWTTRGLPELDSLVNGRALQNPTNFWGGRCVFQRERSGTDLNPADIYIELADEIADRIDFPLAALKNWLAERFSHSERKTLSAERLAYMAWRAHWESASPAADLTSDDTHKRKAARVWDVFRLYYEEAIIAVGFSDREQSLLNGITLRETLRASYVYCLVLFLQDNQSFDQVIPHLQNAPAPMIFVTPSRCCIAVEWIHQQELCDCGRDFFK